MECRQGCGACCIAPSISSAIPGMPAGKPAGVHCVQLDMQLGCKIFDQPDRPAVCGGFRPMQDVCGFHREEAIWLIGELERQTA
ncbi:YkgJ family cysteine cluster protein [Aeromonas salmonicida]|uniref:YkgJ family cysteine cluster protein n=1 Tax=Aeromonas salmonicida TaxID=645 RepID=UPI002857B653|nr:YkgJ family cysteine cluster protein [Aeromonas salmonicida]MDR7020438.1 Fe-S-cluster containining protein [Aeromonas salmonicida]